MIQMIEIIQDTIKIGMAGNNHCLLFFLAKLQKESDSVSNENKELYVIVIGVIIYRYYHMW